MRYRAGTRLWTTFPRWPPRDQPTTSRRLNVAAALAELAWKDEPPLRASPTCVRQQSNGDRRPLIEPRGARSQPMSGRHSAEAVALVASVRGRFDEQQRAHASPYTHDISHPADGEQGTCDVRVRGQARIMVHDQPLSRLPEPGCDLNEPKGAWHSLRRSEPTPAATIASNLRVPRFHGDERAWCRAATTKRRGSGCRCTHQRLPAALDPQELQQL